MSQAFPNTEDTRTVSEVDAHVKGADRDALLALNAELLAALERLVAAYSVSHSPEARISCWHQGIAAIAKARGAQ